MPQFSIDSPSDREATLRGILPESAKARHELLRKIFLAEMDYRREGEDHEYFENIYWCAYLLFLVGDPSDTEPMWRAKHLDMDIGSGFDMEYMVGAGVKQTVDYLSQQGLERIADDISEHFPADSDQEIEE